MRVVICWVGVSGYLTACWRALARREGIDLRLVLFPTVGSVIAPFSSDIAAGLPADLLEEKHFTDAPRVAALVVAHRPDIVVIPGWSVPAFNALPANPHLTHARFILAMDTPRKDHWRDAIRQTLARFKMGRLLSRMDRVIVPGERSWQYARRLGFSEGQIRRGMYGVNFAQFQPLHERRTSQPGGWPRRFLYVGRYEPGKAIDVLLEAHAIYRAGHSDAWPLTCCGKGAMAGQIQAAGAGVEDLGFIQPADQPDIWARAGVFVLASRYDPWPLVIVEACAAGFPILCTEACGSAVELVRPHYNGLMVASGDSADLARGMSLLHASHDQLADMGLRSQQLAAAYSAEIWAQRWMQMFRELAVTD